MNAVDSISFRELRVVQKIIADEAWLEGERRRQPVDPEDPVVTAKVCDVIMRIGADLRETLAMEHDDRVVPFEQTSHHHKMVA